MKIRITESQLEELRKKYSMIEKSESSEGRDSHSGKDPYIKKGFLFIKLNSDKSVPKDAYYFTEEDASELNQMGQDLESLKVSYEEKLKSITGDRKKSEE
jgi:hypothetical protein